MIPLGEYRFTVRGKHVRFQQMAFSKRKVASLANSGLKSVKEASQTRKEKENNTVCNLFIFGFH
jgi:hypothetical protein